MENESLCNPNIALIQVLDCKKEKVQQSQQYYWPEADAEAFQFSTTQHRGRQISYLLQLQTRNKLAGARESLQSPAGPADWPQPLSLPNEPNTDDVMGIIKTSIVRALL